MRNLFSFFDRIFILHLEGSKDRKENVNGLIKTLGTENIEILSAITPSDSGFLKDISGISIKSFPDCFRCGKLECGNAECNNILNAPQIACFQTHLKVMSKVIEHGYKNILVLEDDVYLHEYCRSLFLKQEIIQQFEIALDSQSPALLKLGWALNAQHKSRDKVRIVTPDVDTMSNPAYALNNKAAILINGAFKEGVNHTADVIIHHFDIKGLKRSRIDPPLFSEESWSSGKIESSIHPKEKYLDNLKTQLKTCSSSEVEDVKKKINEHHKKVKKHIKHCRVVNFTEINASDWALSWDAKKSIDEDCELGIHNLLDPLIQSLCFNVQPVFIVSVKIQVPQDNASLKLIMEKIGNLLKETNEFLSVTGLYTLMELNKEKSPLQVLQQVSGSQIIIDHDTDKNSKDSFTKRNNSISKSLSNLCRKLEDNTMNIGYSKNSYNNLFYKKVGSYSAYAYYLKLASTSLNEAIYLPDKPKFTIITVTYNVVETVQITLRSILEQNHCDFELIILDGSPISDTANKAIETLADIPTGKMKSYLVLRGKDNGIYDAMNKAVDIARGNYLIFMNAGDRFYSPDTLRDLSSACNGKDMVYGDVILENKNNQTLIKSDEDTRLLPFGNIFSHQGVMIKTELQKKLGYKIKHEIAADHNLFFRAYLQGASFLKVDMPIAIVEDGGVSADAVQRTLDRWLSVRTEWSKSKLRHLDLIDKFYSELIREHKIPGAIQYFKKNTSRFEELLGIKQ